MVEPLSYWLIGETPNEATVNQPELWLTPTESGNMLETANHLLNLTGWTRDQFLDVFPVRVYVWPNPRWVWMDAGHRSATKIMERSETAGASGLVILGARAAEVFGLAGEEPFEWIGRYVLVPHPSARCSYWKTVPEAKARARDFFSRLLLTHVTTGGRSGCGHA